MIQAGVIDNASARALLLSMFEAAVASAEPAAAVAAALPPKPKGRRVVVGAGKASAAMAAGLDAAWEDVELSGVVVTRYGFAVLAGRIEVIEASHPVPDAASEVAAKRLMGAVSGLGPDDLVIALISGGASSLLALPGPGMTLADEQAVNRALLASGATIAEMNVVRKRLSLIKGGRLAAAAAPARVVTLLISDVPGDDPSAIGSGPTVYDAVAGDPLAVVTRRNIELPVAARRLLEAPAQLVEQTNYTEAKIVASPAMALAAAAEVARAAGVTPVILGDAIEGEAREVGVVLAGIARSVRDHHQPSSPPAVILSGGETTVTMGAEPPGRGGWNTELLLSLAIALDGDLRVHAFAGDTDGIDGTEDAAGALVDPSTADRAVEAGLDLHALLTAHDSYTAFEKLDDLVKTGATRTNVNDFRALLVS